MRTFIELVLKGKTVVGLPQSLHYNNKDYERSDAEDWMARVKEEVGEELAREMIILTWRQQNSFIKGQKLYPLLDNRYINHVKKSIEFAVDILSMCCVSVMTCS